MSNTPDTTNGAAPMQAAEHPIITRLLERANWLEREIKSGGDAVILMARERECRYIAESVLSDLKPSAPTVTRDCGHDMIPGNVAARIVSDIRAILYRDPEGAPDDGLDKFDPDKEWDSETLEAIAGTLEDAGLVPKDAEDYRDVRVDFVNTEMPAAPVPVTAPSALEAAREACRVAELSLRAALLEARENMLLWLHLYDTIAPVAKVADRLQTLVDHAS